tara:strand:- start:335 stop:1162 length:828 start_codon:yes stop_codon:yes gene_type:complete
MNIQNKFRLEISFKDLDQLKSKIEFCRSNNIYQLNIPCKGLIKKEFLLEVVDFIGINFKDLDIIYHYSLYHQFSKNKSVSYSNLLNFLDKCNRYSKNEVLIVSGSKKRNNFEVVDILNDLKFDLSKDFKFGIAYNPYFRENSLQILERQRLLSKLNSGFIKSIWLQFGSDLYALENQLRFLDNNFNFSSDIENSVKIYGSVFIPSKQFLARFKFRPWRGVFLSNDYLNSIDKSIDITKGLLSIYLKNNIFPLIETECSSNKQLNEVKKFISPFLN